MESCLADRWRSRDRKLSGRTPSKSKGSREASIRMEVAPFTGRPTEDDPTERSVPRLRRARPSRPLNSESGAEPRVHSGEENLRTFGSRKQWRLGVSVAARRSGDPGKLDLGGEESWIEIGTKED